MVDDALNHSENFMNFWKKTAIFIILFFVFVLLQRYTMSIGHLDLTILKNMFSIDIYALLAICVVFFFVAYVLASIFSIVSRLFKKVSIAKESESVKYLAWFVLNDLDSQKNLDMTKIISKHETLKNAILLKQDKSGMLQFKKTNVDFVDIYIIKKQINTFLNNGDNAQAVAMALDAVQNYHNFLNILQEELVMVALAAKKNNIAFSFDPKKYKYNFPLSFVEQYFVSLIFLDFELAENDEEKIKILENGNKNHSTNCEIAYKILEFVDQQHSQSKVIAIAKNLFSTHPDRRLAKFLLKFQIEFSDVVDITSNIDESSVEKAWLWLLVAVEKNLMDIAQSMVQKILTADDDNDIFEFLIKYRNKFLNDIYTISVLDSRMK